MVANRMRQKISLMKKTSPLISKQAFWDVDFEKIDFNKNARFVIEKVITRGKLEDFISLRTYYDGEKIKNEIIKSRWLSNIDIYFCCSVFDLKPQEFRCYVMKQSNPELWVY